MIDLHSHILPGIDDGAQDVRVSLDMLAESFSQGVKTVVATPHCILRNEQDIDIFLKNRNASYDFLSRAMKEDGREFPELRLGCELRVPEEFDAMDRLLELCIEDTNYLICEMPYTKWNMNHHWKQLQDLMYHQELFKNGRRKVKFQELSRWEEFG